MSARRCDTCETLANLALFAFILVVLGWLGAALDRIEPEAPDTYTGYGYRPDSAAMVRAAEHQADTDACQRLHGPHASTEQLPDGQHRCVDKHGRRLPRSVITIAHEVKP